MCNKNEIKVVNVLLDIDISVKDRETRTRNAKGNLGMKRFTKKKKLEELFWFELPVTFSGLV